MKLNLKLNTDINEVTLRHQMKTTLLGIIDYLTGKVDLWEFSIYAEILRNRVSEQYNSCV